MLLSVHLLYAVFPFWGGLPSQLHGWQHKHAAQSVLTGRNQYSLSMLIDTLTHMDSLVAW